MAACPSLGMAMKLTYENDLTDLKYNMIEHLIVMSAMIHDMAVSPFQSNLAHWCTIGYI